MEQMLELAQGDHSQGREEHAALDFGELVRDQVLTYEAVFFEAGLELEGRGEEHLTVSGDGGELRQVVDILLDNARKYASPGGKTVVELRHRGRIWATSGQGVNTFQVELPVA